MGREIDPIERRTVLVTRSRIDQDAVAHLESHGFDCVFSPPYASPDEVAERLQITGATALMVSQGKITKAVIGASSKLSVIVKHGSGVNNINIAAAEALDIPVYRSLGGNARAVAEHALALALALWKSLPRLDQATKSGEWLKGAFIGNDMQGANIGLIGYGEIGRELGVLAHAVGMNVHVYDPARADLPDHIQQADAVETLLQSVDIVSLHCPLTPATKNLIDAQRLRLMCNHAVLVNTARGGVVDEQALTVALHEGVIAGAALDSFASEPPEGDSTLWAAPNLIVTPHAAGLTPGAECAMAMGAAQHIIDHFAGKQIDVRFRATSAALGGLED